jgi:threonyl-tRNA synthetase
MPRDEAVKFFRNLGEIYKAEIIAGIPEKDEISLYGQGNWVDLCRGPHVPSTGKLKAFKLTKVAGAYWRGDPRNEMLQRIYGTAWPDKKQLDAYLHRLEEAEKRDHRRIGKELDLFHLQEEAPGAVFWHSKGWTVFQTLIQYMRERQRAAGYEEVNAPELMDAALWQQSGHLEKFGENMYLTKTPDERLYAIKPMNCPGHVQIFKHGLRSYRELPVRLAEFGKVHRYEPSGALHGLMRVRAFTQDDGHCFITEEQITSECVAITKLILDIYRDFGFDEVAIKFADRPPKRVGSDDIWDRAEAALIAASNAAGIDYSLNKGEGAFYGPKLEFVLRDAIGRDWQCGTLQVDLNMPERLGAYYIDEKSAKRTPVMLHRAMFGSLERFVAILLEHHAGRLPAWLAPVQAVALTITDRQDEYVRRVTESLKNQGFRVEIDLRNEKVGFKIREHTLKRVPYLLVAGDKEVAGNLLAVRTRSGKDLGAMSPETFAERLRAELDSRGRVGMEG